MGHSGQLIWKTKPTSSDHLHAEDIVHSQSLGWSELAESVCVCVWGHNMLIWIHS